MLLLCWVLCLMSFFFGGLISRQTVASVLLMDSMIQMLVQFGARLQRLVLNFSYQKDWGDCVNVDKDCACTSSRGGGAVVWEPFEQVQFYVSHLMLR